MSSISLPLACVLQMAKIQAIITRRFDAGLTGLSLSEFMIMYHLSQARDEKMRRSDLAEKVGLTASGITRLLLPMEKVGFVKREADEQDARVSYVSLARGGKSKMVEALENAELLAEDMVPGENKKKLEEFAKFLEELSETVA